MELLESNDLKSELLKKSAMHREGLQDEVKMISERTEKVLTNALIIGGTLAASYFLMRAFSGSSKSKRKSKKVKIVHAAAAPSTETDDEGAESSAPGFVSQIGTALASQAGVFLLTIAKEKLMEYLEAQAEKKAKEKIG